MNGTAVGLLGRDKEAAELVACLQRGAVVGVCGPLGVGKTALVLSVIGSATTPPIAVPVSLAGATSLRAVLDLTARALGRRRPPADRTALCAAVAQLLEMRPRTVVWDDVPAALAGAVSALAEELAPQLDRTRLVIVSRCALAPSSRLPVVTLGPLSRAAMQGLLRRLERERGHTVADALIDHAAGIPLLLELLTARAGTGGGLGEPTALAATLIEGLSVSARMFLQVLSAARAPLSRAAIEAELGDGSGEALHTLLRERLIVFRDEAVAVAPWLTAVADEQLGPPSRAVWDALASIGQRGLAANPADADALLTCARALAARGLAARALALLELHRFARAGIPGETLAGLIRELAIAEPMLGSRCLILFARDQLDCGDVEGARVTLDQLTLRWPTGEDARRAHLLSLETNLRLGVPRSLSAADALIPSDAAVVVSTVVLTVLAGDSINARRMLQTIDPARVSASIAAQRAAGFALSYLAEERYARALVCTRRARRLGALDRAIEQFVILAELIALLELDEIDQATALAARIAGRPIPDGAIWQPLGNDLGTVLRAGVLGRKGELARCIAMLEPVYHALGRTADHLVRAVIGRYLARACTALGQLDRAAELLRHASGTFAEGGLVAQAALCEREWAQWAVACGDRALASRHIASARSRTPGNPYLAVEAWALSDEDAPMPGHTGWALSAYARLRGAERALRLGAWDEAVGHASAAERWFRRVSVAYELGRSRLALAEGLVHLGRTDEARAALASCEAVAQPLGFRPMLVAAALVAAALGERVGDVGGYRTAVERAIERAGDALVDASLAQAGARVGIVAGVARSDAPWQERIERLGLARPGTHVVSGAGQVRLVAPDELPGKRFDMIIDVECTAVVARGKRHPWPSGRLTLLLLLVDAGEEGVPMEILHQRLTGANDYHPLRNRNALYVAVRRLRAALDPLVGVGSVERIDNARYRLAPRLSVAVSNPRSIARSVDG